MSTRLSWRERLLQRWYAIPAVAQRWSRRQAAQAAGQPSGQPSAQPGTQPGAWGQHIPFAPLRQPLAAARVALLTTGGVHLATQPPFDQADPDGDPTYRVLPGDVRRQQLLITHRYYDHTDAERDLNVILPLDHLRDLAARRVIGAVAPHHYGLMGHIDGPHLATLTAGTAPALAQALQRDQVDAVVLTPA